MPIKYNVIEIFTSEETRYRGKPLHEAIVQYVRSLKIAARCVVARGIGGCYENGEVASQNILILSFNMPLKIEIILPSPELNLVLPTVEEMVTDGIVVVEDMEIRCHKAKKKLIPRQIRVRDVMTVPPRRVMESTSLREVIELLLSSEFNGVPVVDQENRPIGMITQGDLISKAGMPVRLGLLADFGKEHVDHLLDSFSLRTAQEIMTRPVITIQEDTPLTEAVDVMLKHHLKRLPVVDSSNRLVGILARVDILRTITHEAPDWKAIRERNVVVHNARFVRDIMRRDTQTVLPDTPIEEVIKVIGNNDIQRVAVVDAKGKFLGLISDRELLGKFSDHRAGLWDYLVSKMPFFEIGQRYKELIKQIQNRRAVEVMKTDLVTVQEEMLIDEAIKLMTEKGIKRLPVLDADGRFKGLVSRDSLLRAGMIE